ncbi:ankyrin-like protein [Vaccinia virus]|nr:ankyrin-like protein [Vaccinia virus]
MSRINITKKIYCSVYGVVKKFYLFLLRWSHKNIKPLSDGVVMDYCGRECTILCRLLDEDVTYKKIKPEIETCHNLSKHIDRRGNNALHCYVSNKCDTDIKIVLSRSRETL